MKTPSRGASAPEKPADRAPSVTEGARSSTSGPALAAALAAAVLALLLQAAGSLNGGPAWWGVHHYAFLPGFWLPAGVLLAAGVLAGFTLAPRLRIPPAASAAVIAAAGGVLFWLGRQTVHFLGDGAFWIEGVRRAHLLWVNEPGTLFGVLALNRITGSPDPAVTFAAVSVGAGVIVLVLGVFLARRLSDAPWGQVAVFGLLVLSGLIRLFFGYVETYPVLAAVVMAYLFLAVRTLQGRGHPAAPALVATAAMGLHVTGVFLLPSLAYLLWRGEAAGRARRLAWMGIPVAALVAGSLIIRSQVDSAYAYGEYLAKLLPLGGDHGTRFAYGMLSAAHLRDFVQEQLLLGPFGAPLALVLLAVAGRRAAGTETRFLLWAGLPWWIMSFLYNREIGAARDWDLFAAATIPFVLLSGMLLARLVAAPGPSRRARAAVGLVLAASAFHTLPWVALGAYPDRSLVHFASLYGPGSTISPFARSYAWEEIGTYYKNLDQADNAIRAFQTAVRADTTNGRVAGMLAGLLIATGRSDEAVPVLETAVRRTPYRAYLHFQLGTLYRERGDLNRARTQFTEALERDPDLAEASIGLAVVERTAGRIAAAERVLQDAIRKSPHEPLLWSHLGLVFQAKGDTARAVESFREALEGNPEDMTSAFNLGLLLMNANRPADARPYFEEVVGRHPQDVDAWVNLGVCLDAMGSSNAALTAFRRAWSVNPYRPEAYFHAVQIHMARGDTASAVETLRAFLTRDATSQYGRAAEALLERLTGDGN